MSALRRVIDDGSEIFLSGELQFWRMDPAHWDTALRSVKSLGIDHVATYLSWRRHEPNRGSIDLRGRRSPELDVHRFLELCAKHDVSVQLKPGPWICAEEPGGGLPDWILDDRQMIALDHAGSSVSGYNAPFKHPMPSYASQNFRQAVETWIRTVWAELGPYLGADGPLVATQLDNEPSLGFQDSMYGFDYHPEAIAAFRAFVLQRHGSLEAISRSWGLEVRSTEGIVAPVPRAAEPERAALSEQERDWIAYQQLYIADYLQWLQDLNQASGAGRLVSFVNLNTHPVRGMPQSGEVIAAALGSTAPAVVGEDHYFEPPVTEDDLAGLALAAAQGIASKSSLVWAPEVQSGIWRSPGEHPAYPDPTGHDLAVWWGAALAFGYQGFNLYMLVNRENWEFAPISETGSPGPLADEVRRLVRLVKGVPGLAAYRPVADVDLAWGFERRASAYRVRGTQAHPAAPWDEPLARAGYEGTVRAAAALTAMGCHYRLVSDEAESSDLVFTDSELVGRKVTPRVRADSTEVIVRLHRNAAGQEVLYLVSCSQPATERPVIVTLDDARATALVSIEDGSEHVLTGGVGTVVGLRSGLNLYEVRY